MELNDISRPSSSIIISKASSLATGKFHHIIKNVYAISEEKIFIFADRLMSYIFSDEISPESIATGQISFLENEEGQYCKKYIEIINFLIKVATENNRRIILSRAFIEQSSNIRSKQANALAKCQSFEGIDLLGVLCDIVNVVLDCR